jgi:hypothetical protein
MNAKEKGLKRVVELIEITRNLRSDATQLEGGLLQISIEELWHVLVSALQTVTGQIK